MHERRYPGASFMTSRAILVEFVVRPEDVERARQLIFENAAASLEKELGCLRFDVLEEATEPCRFTLYEVYRNAADFDVHLQSSHFENFSKATRDLFVSQSVRQFDLKNDEAASHEEGSSDIPGVQP
jgi:(4S)-4-hydroxy-5-phosphonooxypentane-2,3-dione isomerase